jgi:hypothetical protein
VGGTIAGSDLPASGVTAASYGSATNVPVIVVDATGRITSATTAAVSGGGGSGAVTLITETALVANAASVTFSSISASYRDLLVVVRGRGDKSATDVDVRVQFNGDTGFNYDAVYQISNASSTMINGDFIGGGYGYCGVLAAATTVASAAGHVEFRIYDYRGTTFHKTYRSRSANKRANTVGSFYEYDVSGDWRSTAAISSVVVFPDSGNFIAGTVVSLYGIS